MSDAIFNTVFSFNTEYDLEFVRRNPMTAIVATTDEINSAERNLNWRYKVIVEI